MPDERGPKPSTSSGDAEARRAHKAAVKEEKREKRKTKVPKAVKKAHGKEKR